jgi:exocyst complex component 3
MISNYANAVADRLGIPVESLSEDPHWALSRGGYADAARDARRVAFETIVAGVNDTRRCRSLTAQTQKTILNALGMKDDVMVRTFDHTMHLFNRIHAEARRMISIQVLNDPGLVEVMSSFYGSKADGSWATGESMTTLLATVEDYLSDTEAWLTAEVAVSVTETLFEHLIERLFILFTKQAAVVAAHTAARLEADERALTQSMTIRMSTNKAIGRIARLQNLRGLVCATTPDAFVHEYGVLLGNWPDAGLDCVAAVLSARGDFDKTTSRATLERCRDVCITKLAAIAGERPSVGVGAATSAKRARESRHRRTGSAVSYTAFNQRFKDFTL